MTTSSHDNIKSPVSKKVFLTRYKLCAMRILHESIAKDLAIDRECWLEQMPIMDGIFLRVSHDASESTIKNDINLTAQDEKNGPQELVPKNTEEWSSAYTSDRLYLEMCSTGRKVVIGRGTDKEEKVNWYYTEAAKYSFRSSAGDFGSRNAKYRPIFHLNKNDFSPGLRANLLERLKTSKESIRRVVEDAVFRIFLARHKMIFHQYIEAQGLHWRFES
jgi:hypothetical protein